MSDQLFSWLAGGIGLVGFWLSGKKLWWSWYVNIVNQAAWVVFALVTGYYAFLITAAFYTFVFSRNAYLWTKEHRLKVHEERLDTKERTIKYQGTPADSRSYLDSFPVAEPKVHKSLFKVSRGFNILPEDNHKLKLVPNYVPNIYVWECFCGMQVSMDKEKFKAMMLPKPKHEHDVSCSFGNPTCPGY